MNSDLAFCLMQFARQVHGTIVEENAKKEEVCYSQISNTRSHEDKARLQRQLVKDLSYNQQRVESLGTTLASLAAGSPFGRQLNVAAESYRAADNDKRVKMVTKDAFDDFTKGGAAVQYEKTTRSEVTTSDNDELGRKGDRRISKIRSTPTENEKWDTGALEHVRIGFFDNLRKKGNDLPLRIDLATDFDEYSRNRNQNFQRFTTVFCGCVRIPVSSLRIEKIERGSTLVYCVVLAPHGEVIVEQLVVSDNHQLFNDMAAGLQTKVKSIQLGHFLSQENNVLEAKMNERWNRVYVNDQTHFSQAVRWSGSLDRGGKPYFNPIGWTRFGIKVAENETEFDKKWGHWHVAYHGTKQKFADIILSSGLKTGLGCWTQGEKVVYVSPSIEYCAHPRYAEPWSNPNSNGKYHQLVFQCRINPFCLNSSNVCAETLLKNKSVQIDKNFRNSELEWVIRPPSQGIQYITDDIICYGLMLRTTDDDPQQLPSSHWWNS